MALNRVRRDKIFFAGVGFDLVAIELRKGTVFLDCTQRSRVASLGVELGGPIDGKGILVIRRTFASVRGCSSLLSSG